MSVDKFPKPPRGPTRINVEAEKKLSRSESGKRSQARRSMSAKGRPKSSLAIASPARKTPARRGRDIIPAAQTSLSPRGGAKHRTLKKQILALLADAGSGGQTIEELAKKLGVLKPRIQGWFSGTGKRTGEIEKIAPGRWRFKAP